MRQVHQRRFSLTLLVTDVTDHGRHRSLTSPFTNALASVARIPVRGHCVFWGVEKRVPEWLFDMTSQQVLDEIDKRINDVVPRYNQR